MDTGLLQLGSNAPGPPIEANKARQVRALLHLGFGVQTLTAPCPASPPSNTITNPEPSPETIPAAPTRSVLGIFPQNVSTSMN